jgi:hypothetical protein
MTENRGAALPPSSDELIERLRVEIETGRDSVQEGVARLEDATSDRASEHLSTQRELVLAAVEAFIDNASAAATVEAQITLTAAARRQLAARRWPLATVLQVTRLAAGIDAETVAASAGIVVGDMLSIETGTVALWKVRAEDRVSTLIRWIKRLDIPWDKARRAALRSLPRPQTHAYAGNELDDESEERVSFIMGLVSAIDAESGHSSG